jgi:hypothetical protein
MSARSCTGWQPAADPRAEGFEALLGHPQRHEVDATSSIVTTILAVMTPAISGFVIFVFSLIFYLICRPRLRRDGHAGFRSR